MGRWSLIVLMYASAIPLWSLTGSFLDATNDVGFYTGVVLAIGTAAYLLWTTKLLVNAVFYAIGKSKTNSES